MEETFETSKKHYLINKTMANRFYLCFIMTIFFLNNTVDVSSLY